MKIYCYSISFHLLTFREKFPFKNIQPINRLTLELSNYQILLERHVFNKTVNYN